MKETDYYYYYYYYYYYKVSVLRRISDYGYITAPLSWPFTIRLGYGGCILDLNNFHAIPTLMEPK